MSNDDTPQKVDSNTRNIAMSMLVGDKVDNVSSSSNDTDIGEPLAESKGSVNNSVADMLSDVLEKKKAHTSIDENIRKQVVEKCFSQDVIGLFFEQ